MENESKKRKEIFTDNEKFPSRTKLWISMVLLYFKVGETDSVIQYSLRESVDTEVIWNYINLRM